MVLLLPPHRIAAADAVVGMGDYSVDDVDRDGVRIGGNPVCDLLVGHGAGCGFVCGGAVFFVGKCVFDLRREARNEQRIGILLTILHAIHGFVAAGLDEDIRLGGGAAPCVVVQNIINDLGDLGLQAGVFRDRPHEVVLPEFIADLERADQAGFKGVQTGTLGNWAFGNRCDELCNDLLRGFRDRIAVFVLADSDRFGQFSGACVKQPCHGNDDDGIMAVVVAVGQKLVELDEVFAALYSKEILPRFAIGVGQVKVLFGNRATGVAQGGDFGRVCGKGEGLADVPFRTLVMKQEVGAEMIAGDLQSIDPMAVHPCCLGFLERKIDRCHVFSPQ